MTRFLRPFKQYFRRDGDNGDNVQWNSITQASIEKNSASNRIRTQARKREEMFMWIWVK